MPMDITRLSDVIEPDVWRPYFINRTMELTEFLRSGIMTHDPYFDSIASGPNTLVNMPYFNDLSGDASVIRDQGFIEPDRITTDQDVAVKQAWVYSWGANGLSALLSGADPYNAITELVAQWWARFQQGVLLSMLKGVFQVPGMTEKVLDVSGLSGEAGELNGSTFIDATQKMGDAKGVLTAVAMHSAMQAHLAKLQLIQYEETWQKGVVVPTFLGKRISVDDGIPYDPATKIGEMFIFAPGTIALGNGSHPRIVPVEHVREGMAYSGEDYLVVRRIWLMHIRGLRWLDVSRSAEFPTRSDLENPANYKMIYEPKKIGMVKLIARAS